MPKGVYTRKKENINKWRKMIVIARVGYKHSEKTKIKIGIGNKGKKRSLEAIEKNRFTHS